MYENSEYFESGFYLCGKRSQDPNCHLNPSGALIRAVVRHSAEKLNFFFDEDSLAQRSIPVPNSNFYQGSGED